MKITLSYAIKFVLDMDESINFYKNVLGLSIKSQSPKWTEFETGDTILALHLTDDRKIAGTVQLGFGTDNIDSLYSEMISKNVKFTQPPTPVHNMKLAEFLDNDGSAITLSG